MKVAIVGLGAMGSMAAWQLAQAGVHVEGYEQFGLAHARGGVGGESRLFRTAYKEGPQYVPLLKRSRQLWRELESQTASNLLQLNGGLTIGHPGDEAIAKVLESIQQFDIEHQVLDIEDARQRFPQHRFDPQEVVILDRESGFLRPELAVSAALRRATDLGANLHGHTRVEAIEQRGDGAWLRIDGSERRFDKVLVTAGAWVDHLLPQLGGSLYARKLILSWFPARDIAAFAPERFPIFTRRSQGYFSFGVPSVEGSMVKIGISTPGPVVEDVNAFDSQISEHELAETRHVIHTFLSGLDPDPVRTSGHLDAFSPDRHCVIGHLPGEDRLLVIGGFSGHGFKLAPAIGEIACQLLREQAPGLAVGEFALERLAICNGSAHAL
ncbi:N-methyl-L-tryptophan oxidase [Pseudomonas sp. dw_358]|uniref:N-methyl-L-tryptophan oxidase n=1 Tax=Pseudomonas sp. dw_358 TaxID=2720083 RepID=UPI001BD4B024|nr:N-methyl-L-tryptophan oxidase [Pseudomonas sp. dw_358]